MPYVSNPSAFNLYCEPLDTEIRAGGRVAATEEQAAKVSRCVFVIIEEEPSATPVRRAAKRGSRVAEVTDSPEVETR